MRSRYSLAALALLAALPMACQRGASLRTTKAVEHVGKKLYDYMNGAAEIYFQHGFVKMREVRMEREGRRALVELYLLDSDANAKKLFDMNCDETSTALEAGSKGCYWPGQEFEGLFHRGPYLCRIYVYATGEAARAMLQEVAAKMDAEAQRER